MKKLLLAAIAAFACLSAFADDINLYVRNTSNVESSYAVSNLRKISFSNGNVVLTTQAGKTESIAISSVSKMYFSTVSAGINDTFGKNAMTWDGENLTFETAVGKVNIYQPSGVLVMCAKTADAQSISLARLPKGIYLVKVGEKSFKIVKK